MNIEEIYNSSPKKQFMRLDLQFFAKDGKTEKATPKKREDARKEGQVAKSNELNTAVIIIGFFALMSAFGTMYIKKLKTMTVGFMTKIPLIITEEGFNLSATLLGSLIKDILILSIPLWGGLFVIAFTVTIVQVGYKPTTKAIQPKFSKLNPMKGFKKIFSKDALIELVKSIFKVVILSAVLYNTIKDDLYVFFKFYDFSTIQILYNIADLVGKIGFYVGGSFLAIAVADYAYQKFKFEDSIKMSKQDLKDEYKQSEGDPQIKGKRRQKMREMSMRRMMKDVPKADVIITNPTHFAVAIKYDKTSGKAPLVLAKGVDNMAQKIKEVAREHNVEIVENKPLARSLYATVEIGEEISPELYAAVAEVLAFVYSLKEQ